MKLKKVFILILAFVVLCGTATLPAAANTGTTYAITQNITVVDGNGNYTPEYYINYNETRNVSAVEAGSNVQISIRAVSRSENLEYNIFKAVYTENGEEKTIDLMSQYGNHAEGYYFTMPSADVKLEIEIQSLPDVTSVSGHGTVSFSGGVVNSRFGTFGRPGKTVNITVAPEEGYEVEIITMNGTPVKDGSFTMPHSAAGVVVTYREASKAPAWYGDGSAAEYEVGSGQELYEMAQIVNGTLTGVAQDSFAGKVVKLANDIDLSGIAWTAIGGETSRVSLSLASQEELDQALETYGIIYDTSGDSYKRGAGDERQTPWSASASYYYITGSVFSGTFDGCGKTIRNINVNTTNGYTGFFGNVNGTVKNFTLKGSVTSTGSNQDFVGGVIGKLSMGGHAERVTSYVTVKADNCFNVGGIAGCVGSKASFESKDNTFVDECLNYGNVTGYQAVGGIAGHNAGQIRRCANHGTIDAKKTSSKSGVGGIVGRNGENNTATDSGTVLDCYNTGTIGNNQAKWSGGIAGFNPAYSSVINCYNTGTVYGVGQYNPIVGQSESSAANNAIVRNCWYLDTTKTYDESGVYGGMQADCGPKTEAQMKEDIFVTLLGESYAADGDGSLNGGYPVLAWQGGSAAPVVHNVTLPAGSAQDGYLTVAQGETTVRDGDSFSFYVAAISGYEIVSVKAGETALTLTDGKYTIEKVTADVEVVIQVKKSGSGGSSGGSSGGKTNGGSSGGKTDGSSSGGKTDGSGTDGKTDGSGTDGKTDGSDTDGKIDVSDSQTTGFMDVVKGSYYEDAVNWAADKDITKGTDDTHFSPNALCTRAQIVTFLWRAAGKPEAASNAADNADKVANAESKAESSTDNIKFTDVKSGSYYEKAVEWAVANSITKGTTSTTFEPDKICSRAQCISFISRALGGKAEKKATFSDVPQDAYYADAVSWATQNNITAGIGSGLFAPNDDCTRGQIVTFLYRAYSK